MHRACEVATSWPGAPTIAVNASSVRFMKGRVGAAVRNALASSGPPARRLELELTEGTLLKGADAVMGGLAELEALGVRLAIDDFGAGHSSLSYLWRLPLDRIEIDPSFMEALTEGDGRVRAMRHTIVSPARTRAGRYGRRYRKRGASGPRERDWLR